MKKSFQFPFEAHYVISHDPNFQESEIWIVFHGYGQLAEFFIRKFNPFFNPDRLIVAPEGTNYGYLQNFQGRVGANWMTKHERETAIANNHRYLDGLMESILQSYSVLPKIKVLGFSQGAATATRWASRWSEKIEHLVLWSGGFAHDLKLTEAKEKFSSTKFTIVLGDQDSMITQESLEKQSELMKKLEKTAEIIHFEGGHELNQEVLKKLFE